MRQALKDFVILGGRTPVAYLGDVLNHEAFRSGATFTDFIPRHMADWSPAGNDAEMAALAYIADDLSAGSRAEALQAAGPAGVPTPWQTLGAGRP